MDKITKYQTELQKKDVIVANVVTRATQSLSLAEKRILFAGIAKLGGKNGEIKLTAKEYAETYDVDINTAYDQLKSAAKNMLNRRLTFQIRDGKAVGIATILWLQGYIYFDKEGYITFRFSEYVFPFLFELQREFTKYQLKQACALRSIHSWRMLEILEQMRDKRDHAGWLFMPIEDFWHAMGTTESYKKTFGLLRTKVIEPSIRELTMKDGWMIEWEPIKRGRKVVALKFKFERSHQGRLDI